MNHRLIRGQWVGFVLAMMVLSALSARADATSMAVHFIAPWEGFSAEPYQDAGGCWTIGYGQLLSCEQHNDPGRYGTVTEAEAEAWMRERVERLINQIRYDLGYRFLRDEQLAALASLAYNIGITAFDESELVRMIVAHEPIGEIAREFLSWDHVGGEVSRGLSRRRLAEVGLFFFGTSHFK